VSQRGVPDQHPVRAQTSDHPDHAAGRQGGGLHADIELGSAEVARRQESPYVDGQVAFRRPTAASGSVVFTRRRSTTAR
jgi:hypothetical protein